MKRFMKALKRQDGFTLVELMVVVAIIGLLSAVAVPNFKKYQAKAKVTEAKLQLSALYTAESSFFSDFNMYGKCLRYMGFDPDREAGNRYYAIGFFAGIGARSASAHSAAVNSGLDATAVTGCPDTATAYDGSSITAAVNGTALEASFYYAGKGVGAVMANAAFAPVGNPAATAGSCTASATGVLAATIGNCVGTQADTTEMTFVAAAVGVISGETAYQTAATASGLTINHNKILSTRANGY